MINMYPGFTDKGEPCLFDPESDFTIFPEIEFKEIEPNTKYFIYADTSGRTYIKNAPSKEYYVSFGFLETDRKSNWINMQYAW